MAPPAPAQPPVSAPKGDAGMVANRDTGAVVANAAPMDPPAPASAFVSASRVLPQGELLGWKQSGPVKNLSAKDMFQEMDGAAEEYVAYGVKQFGKAEYRKPGSTIVVSVEVYEFGEPIGAFGYFSHMLSDSIDPASFEAKRVDVGAGGYLGSTQLNFWKGTMLVSLNVSDEGDEENAALMRDTAKSVLADFAKAVAGKVEGVTTAPAHPLPAEGLVWGGATWAVHNILGVAESGGGWVGHYRAADGTRYRVAKLERASAAEAQKTFDLFKGEGATPVADLGDKAHMTKISDDDVVVVLKGNDVWLLAGPVGSDAEHVLAPPAKDARPALLRAAISGQPAPSAPPAAAGDAGADRDDAGK